MKTQSGSDLIVNFWRRWGMSDCRYWLSLWKSRLLKEYESSNYANEKWRSEVFAKEQFGRIGQQKKKRNCTNFFLCKSEVQKNERQKIWYEWAILLKNKLQTKMSETKWKHLADTYDHESILADSILKHIDAGAFPPSMKGVADLWTGGRMEWRMDGRTDGLTDGPFQRGTW